MTSTDPVGVGRTRRRRRFALAITALAAGLVIANAPVTTRQGVNFEVSEHRLPLYLKSFEFLDRDGQYRELAREITRGASSDEERVLAVFGWTARRVRRQPEGWAVIDDHILNIIIRGYGTDDQRADVFTTLSTYAGVPAFWKFPDVRDGVIFSFVRVDGRWVVVDVANEFVFRNTRGGLASAEDCAESRVLLPAAAQSMTVGSTPYPEIVKHVRLDAVPRPLRAELQMPWPRLVDVTLRTIGYRHDGFEQ